MILYSLLKQEIIPWQPETQKIDNLFGFHLLYCFTINSTKRGLKLAIEANDVMNQELVILRFRLLKEGA